MTSLSLWQLLLLFTLYQSGDLKPGAALTLAPQETDAAGTHIDALHISVEKDGWVKLDEGVWFQFDEPNIEFRVKGEEQTIENYRAGLGITVKDEIVTWMPKGASAQVEFWRERDDLVFRTPDPNLPEGRIKIWQN